MTGFEIIEFTPVNRVDADRVSDLANSIKANGWKGAPVLVMASTSQMITGSHRLAALQMIDKEYSTAVFSGNTAAADRLHSILNTDVAVEVGDIINSYCEDADCTIDNLPYDSLSEIFAGTKIEKYASEIVEW